MSISRFKLLLLTALLCAPTLTLAQTIFEFSVAGSDVGPSGVVGGFSGTLYINTTTGTLVNYVLEMDPVQLYGGSFPSGTQVFTPADSTFSLFQITPNTQALNFEMDGGTSIPGYVDLDVDGATLKQFGGSTLLSGSAYTPPGVAEEFGLTGVVTQETFAATPEPSSLILTVSGLAGLVAFRRRFFR
jgi:hypothetical protein